MGHYSDDYEADEERRRKDKCESYRKWIGDHIAKMESPEELEMVYEIAKKSKESYVVLRLLADLLKIKR